MSSHTINTFTNENYNTMWCRHARVPNTISNNFGSAVTAINRVHDEDFCVCLGKKCPALVFARKEGDNWIGYCGADHPNRR